MNIAVEITTTIREIALEVPLNGIERLDRQHLSRRIGALGPARIREVNRALGYALGWEELPDVQ
jgi:mRNA-degrading endonuclease toxin of MazEF toxin-antitoxin module